MFAGTGSDVGKSIIAAAFCRIFRQDGYSPAPFKAQNMALNSYATPEGLEIGRAQAVQAEAAGIPCHSDMNPLLLKPSSDHTSQVVLHGKPIGNKNAYEYWRRGSSEIDFRKEVCAAFDRLALKYNPIVMEGAGSIAEINLKDRDLVNMSMARHAGAAVILVADIDRGGVFASAYGSIMLQTPEDRQLIKGIIINKFRGDMRLFDEGRKMLEELCGVPVLGVVPYYKDIYIDEEDSVSLEQKRRQLAEGKVNIAVVLLRHISNFTDFDTLERDPRINLFYTNNVQDLQRADIIILPGTKSTLDDLLELRRNGCAQAILRAHRDGKTVVGICGGYQMLGLSVDDPDGIEGPIATLPGLGLLPIRTVITPEKTTRQVTFQFAGQECRGYEIHQGVSTLVGNASERCIVGDASERCVVGDTSERCNSTTESFDSHAWKRDPLFGSNAEAGTIIPAATLGGVAHYTAANPATLGGVAHYAPPPSFVDTEKYIRIAYDKLPHWQQPGKTMFVTFRLADSLPQEKLQELTVFKTDWLNGHPLPWTDETRRAYDHEVRRKTDHWLDQGYGACLLARPDLRQIVADTLMCHHGRSYWIHHYVIMPNHVHILLSSIGEVNVRKSLGSVKRFTANAINKVLGTRGEVWQRLVFDHLVRDVKHYDRFVHYIADNPRHLPPDTFTLFAAETLPAEMRNAVVGNASERCIVGDASERCIVGDASERCNTPQPVTLGSVTHYDQCIGTYIHGFLDNAPVIDYLLRECSPNATLGGVTHSATLGGVAHYPDSRDFKEEQYNKLADHVRQYVDIDRIYQILGSSKLQTEK